jgi:hypothetical protein
MKRLLPFLSLGAILLIAGCSWWASAPSSDDLFPDDQSNGEVSSVSSEISSEAELPAASYRGVLSKGQPTIYMQGTHMLTLPDGRFLLLESEDVNLDPYVGKTVEVHGAVRPTIEEGGAIMRVESVALVEDVSSTSSASSAPVPTTTPPTPVPENPPSPPTSDAAAARAQAMARANMAPEQWTQQYCSSHMGFCIPVHRNWFYNGFGAVNPSLWHVEVSSEAVENVGDGPLVIDLLSGTVESAGATDGQVKMEGNRAVGYRSWTKGRHFEVSAPAVLRTAVEYITKNLAESASTSAPGA